MKILVVQETDWLTRYPILHHRMLEALSLAGHRITVIDYDILWRQKGRLPLVQRRQEWPNCAKIFDQSAVTVIRPAMIRLPGIARLSWLVANLAELRRLLEERPDVVVAYSISNAFLAQLLARRRGIPFVHHVMEPLHTHAEFPPMRAVAQAIEKRVTRGADRVIVVNTSLRGYAESSGVDPDRVDVIPMGVTVSYPDRQAEERIRAALGVRDTDLVLLYAGWLYPPSGLRELIQALPGFRHRLPNVKIVIVGDGELRKDLERLRDEHALGDLLILTGGRPASEVPGLISAADLCLLPAYSNEAMKDLVPTKMIQYMEHGKPVIATRLPGIVAEFGDLPGITYIDKPEDVLEVAGGLVTGYSDPRAEARRLGEGNRRVMVGRESWEAATARFGALLQDVADTSRGASASC
jgi:glycosyltransferase involved in cell wall biosynthesis